MKKNTLLGNFGGRKKEKVETQRKQDKDSYWKVKRKEIGHNL